LIVSAWLFDCICNLSERWLPKWVIKRLLCVKGGMGFQSCLRFLYYINKHLAGVKQTFFKPSWFA
ncbi:hypothetical protein T05_4471, partial [Trichinella murrelli]